MPSSGNTNLKTTDNSTQLPSAHTTHLVIQGHGPYWFVDYIRCLNIYYQNPRGSSLTICYIFKIFKLICEIIGLIHNVEHMLENSHISIRILSTYYLVLGGAVA
jgi:lantibiotic modifying enzyme